MSDQRLMELEIKISFQERTIETLDQVVVEQGKTIDALGRRIEGLEARLRALLEGDDGETEDDPS